MSQLDPPSRQQVRRSLRPTETIVFFFGMVTGHMIPDIAYQVLRDTVIDCSIILVLGVL